MIFFHNLFQGFSCGRIYPVSLRRQDNEPGGPGIFPEGVFYPVWVENHIKNGVEGIGSEPERPGRFIRNTLPSMKPDLISDLILPPRSNGLPDASLLHPRKVNLLPSLMILIIFWSPECQNILMVDILNECVRVSIWK